VKHTCICAPGKPTGLSHLWKWCYEAILLKYRGNARFVINEDVALPENGFEYLFVDST
jgi:hypothetical protein